MLAQASTGLIETWWVSRLGTNALAGTAIALPAIMLMRTISTDALGRNSALSGASELTALHPRNRHLLDQSTSPDPDASTVD